MSTLQNICVKHIARVITTNRKDPNCLLKYIPNTLYCVIINEITKRQQILRKRKNKRHRRANKRLEVRYMNRRRVRYGRIDIDFPSSIGNN